MKQLVVYYVPTYMPVSKLTYKRHKNQIMTDDRVCCENIAAAMFVTVKEMRAGPS